MTVRKRHAKRPGASKTAQLEQKLDGLVSLLKSATQSIPLAADPNITAMWAFGHDNNIQTNSTTSSNSTLPTLAAADSESTSYHSPKSPVPYTSEPSPHEAEEYLRIFRTQRSKYFPFIYIPPTTSAQHLLQERPFLSLCIMVMPPKSTSQQLALGKKIRHVLARKMLFEHEKNLDLLLGLLAYIGWYVICEFAIPGHPLTLPSGPTIKCMTSHPCPSLHNLPFR
jgi:hypothetical protein